MIAETSLFYLFGALALVSATVAVGFARTLLAGAVWLALTVVSISGVCVVLNAEWVGFAHLFVRGSALLVLLLFAVALGAERAEEEGRPQSSRVGLAKGLGATAVLGIGVAVAGAAWLGVVPVVDPEGGPGAGFGGFRAQGLALWGSWVVAVELVGLVLASAALGMLSLVSGRRD